MKVIRFIIEMIILTVLSFCAFGGGGLFTLPFVWYFEIEGQAFELLFFGVTLVSAPIAWWLAPKISDKIL